MTPLDVPECFDREMGCTATELRAGIAQALGESELEVTDATALATFDDGTLRLTWAALPHRRIASLEIPRLRVAFRFRGLTPERRYEVQRQFDRVYQRGGG